MYVSRKFIEAVKLSPMQNYRLALNNDYHPTTLSKILNHAQEVQFGDPRIVNIGVLLGLKPEECFTQEEVK